MSKSSAVAHMADANVKDLFLDQFDREVELTRRLVEKAPEGKADWKPSPKSMPYGRLMQTITTMPSWIEPILKENKFDIAPKEGHGSHGSETAETRQQWLQALDKTSAAARKALSSASIDTLNSDWKLLEGGKVVMNGQRYEHLRDWFTHLAHHRGQATVYLRLLDAQVPAIYGPSADDHRF